MVIFNSSYHLQLEISFNWISQHQQKNLLFTDQYHSWGQNKSGLPLCSDPAKVLAFYRAERNALIFSSEVEYNCPVPCISTEYQGTVTRFQSGKLTGHSLIKLLGAYLGLFMLSQVKRVRRLLRRLKVL